MGTNANIAIALFLLCRTHAKRRPNRRFGLPANGRQAPGPISAGCRSLAPAGAIHQLHRGAVVFTQTAQVETVAFEFTERLEQF